MSVSFGGMGDITATFKTYGTINAGSPVKLYGNGTVQACADGDRFCGIATYVAEDGHATVQLGGYVSIGYSGASAPTVGYGRLMADGAGKAEAAADTYGGEYLIVEVDTTAKTVGFVI